MIRWSFYFKTNFSLIEVSVEGSVSFECRLVKAGEVSEVTREVVSEEPLVIFVGDQLLVTLMCTPGGELEIALGYLITEGIIRSRKEIGGISFCEQDPAGNRNVVRIILAAGRGANEILPPYRRVFSSCSVCGAEAVDELVREVARFERPPARLCPRAIAALGQELFKRQRLFPLTGGAHAAALAELPLTSESIRNAVIREDIGRHNTIDKVVGAAAGAGRELAHSFLFLSGRLSYEMVAKAARAGIADVAGISAPTSLAVRLAQHLGMFLAGFAREDSMTVYSGFDAPALEQESEKPDDSDS